MEMKEPMALGYATTNPAIPHLRHYILNRIEDETDVSVLEKIYAIISPTGVSFKEKFAQAKSQTDEFCTSDLAAELEAEGYMVNKPCPYDSPDFDIDAAIREDEVDENAPQEWLAKMFPELYA